MTFTPATVQSIDSDLRETTRRYDRALAEGNLELADVYLRDYDVLLDRRLELMSAGASR